MSIFESFPDNILSQGKIHEYLASPFAGIQFTVSNLTGQADSNLEYSVPAWVIVKTWNTFGVPVSLLWDTFFSPSDECTIDYGKIFSENTDPDL